MKIEFQGRPTKIHKFEYHRNGVSGRAFFAFTVTFQFPLRNGDFELPMSALITWFSPDRFGEKENWDLGEDFAVIPLGPFGPELENTMRGDRIAQFIKPEVIAEYKKRYDHALKEN